VNLDFFSMNGGKRRTKFARAQLRPMGSIAPGPDRALVKRGRWLRLLILAIAAPLTAVLVHGSGPAFSYRLGQRAEREIRVRVPEFNRRNQIKTNALRQAAADSVKPILFNDPAPIRSLAARLQDLLEVIAKSSKYEDIPEALRTSWSLSRSAYDDLKEACDTPQRLEETRNRIDRAFIPLIRDGVLGPQALPISEESSSMLSIRSTEDPAGSYRSVARREVESLRIGKADEPVGKAFIASFASPETGRTLWSLIAEKLVGSPTLIYQDALTLKARQEAQRSVKDLFDVYRRGEVLVEQGEEISEEQLLLLWMEHETALRAQTWGERVRRAGGVFLLVAAMFALMATMVHRQEPRIACQTRRVATLCALAVTTIACVRLIAQQSWDAELIPVAVAGMILAIAYKPRFALMMTFAFSILTALTLGTGIGPFLVLMGGTSAGVLTLQEVRTRTKLIKVGAITALGYFTLTWATGLWENQPSALIFSTAAWRGCWGLMAGFLLGGSLPFIENAFGIVTGISLLELGDISHPLLQELVRRAPGTYNHSVTVATIAEAAVERIGGDALLVRVGAYFHDIGKMLKPRYFIENQAGADNRHDNLSPAMSTLIIIGHVKDGVVLARQHHLPEPIIDLIEQHHGTTLVEYFFREATRRGHDDPDAADVSESAFRYPGPKPKTKEAAVMMITDAVESASRTLSEPTPARLENLVREIIDKRLRDDQFDQCSLTLNEIAIIRESLIKSLIGIYHGRVKYPEQRTA
jgi:putative nucleotidyltransferase with HDIG domain